MKPWFLKLKKAAQNSLAQNPASLCDWHSAENFACTVDADPTGSSLLDAAFIAEASPTRVLALINELESAYLAQCDIFVPGEHD